MVVQLSLYSVYIVYLIDLQTLLSAQLVIHVMRMQSVMILMVATCVSVCQDLQEMDTTVQVYGTNPIQCSNCDCGWNQLTDVDECEAKDICPSLRDCKNTVGSYDCECKPGYKDNGTVCVGTYMWEQ